MHVDVFVLGISATSPTKKRNLISLLLRYWGRYFLFDCGENAQKQMLLSSIGVVSIERIFITHFHGDHINGLPGILATMDLQEREEPLFVYGPRGIKKKVEAALELAGFSPTFDVIPKEVEEGIVYKEKNFKIEAVKLKHSVRTFGYVFKEKDSYPFLREKAEALGIPPGPLYKKLKDGEEIFFRGRKIRPEDVLDFENPKKGKKIAFIFDTMPSESYISKLEGIDLLFHDSTFLEKDKDKAEERKHSTAKDAAEVAKKANVKVLKLIHFSPRYKDLKPFLEEAREVFPNSFLSRELEVLSID